MTKLTTGPNWRTVARDRDQWKMLEKATGDLCQEAHRVQRYYLKEKKRRNIKLRIRKLDR